MNRCKKDIFKNLHDDDNIHIRPRKPHELHHNSQGNNSPHETLQHYHFFVQVMSPKAQELYKNLLDMSLDEFYDEKYIRK